METITDVISGGVPGVRVQVLVQPRAAREKVVGLHDGRVKVALTAPPVDNAANDALILFFASALGVRRNDVHIESGATGRRKVVFIAGVSAATTRARLLGD